MLSLITSVWSLSDCRCQPYLGIDIFMSDDAAWSWWDHYIIRREFLKVPGFWMMHWDCCYQILRGKGRGRHHNQSHPTTNQNIPWQREFLRGAALERERGREKGTSKRERARGRERERERERKRAGARGRERESESKRERAGERRSRQRLPALPRAP